MLLTEFHGHTTATIDAPPAEVFAAISNIERLPAWNARIASVTRAPSTPLVEGTEWTVQMSVPPAKWPSRSRLVAYDPDHMYFEHTSQSDDGNPSYVVWQWSVTPDPDGAKVTVEWTVHPKTFWRQLLFAKMRRKQLQREVPTSLHALAYRLAPSEPPNGLGHADAWPP
jgi:uncharacterized protein YndB with AHSA1/START domain